MRKIILSLTLCLFGFFASAATFTSVQSGDWLDGTTWDLGTVPDGDDLIIIDTPHTVEISGDDITLDNTQVIINGTLLFDDAFFGILQFQPSLVLTGANSGILVNNGGMIDEDVFNITIGALETESLAFISVDGTAVWNACSFQSCIDGSNAFLNGIGEPDLEQAGDISGGPGGILLPNSSNPLPVEFIFFTAQYQSGSVYLKWATATEITNSHFEVERSSDGVTFEKIGEILGNGDSEVRIDYQYIDHEAAVATEFLYYRLKQVDYDGEFEYSITVFARRDDFDPLELLIRPTVFSDHLTITLNSLIDEEVNIKIHDLRGSTVYDHTKPLTEGINDFQLENLNFLNDGTYIVSITGGTFSLTEKVIHVN